MNSPDKKPLTVVAVVKFNEGEALVLNRTIQLVYKKMGNNFIGSDGPLRDHLFYSQGRGRFVAFAGRELSLPMEDGSLHRVKDHWWSGTPEGYMHVTAESFDNLKKCYVFTGFNIPKDAYLALRSRYTGCVYPYWDYQKIINFDDQRSDFYKRNLHLERRCKALIQAVKTKHRQLEAVGAV